MRTMLATPFVCAFLIGAGWAAAQTPQRPPAASLTTPKGTSEPVDALGFVHRWMVLEPVPVSGRLTEAAVHEALQAAPPALPGDSLPHDGESVSINGSSYIWHALDTRNYNFNLYHFAW